MLSFLSSSDKSSRLTTLVFSLLRSWIPSTTISSFIIMDRLKSFNLFLNLEIVDFTFDILQ
ncbi:MAG: hypothetical protein FD179_328 [Erysipelotrichaceae bacterium]|nr:MAG: hypothetical protein FD179_328 [Erysipelotrichaceae bacterium]